MSMLARYKRNSQSMMELVKLIEESAEPKRSTLMNMVTQEDPEFGAKIQRRLFDYGKLKALDESIIAEIIAVCPSKIMALSLVGENETFIKMAERCMGNKFSEYKVEKEILNDRAPTEMQVEAARSKLVSEARKLETDGAFKLMDYEKIDAAGGTVSSPALTGAGGPTGSALADSGAPGVDSFQMELPPNGLNGERFEEHIKKELGLK
ncbi:MAG: FliG C-terminal domain-containing protein [Bdellovibrionota bacterium]